MTPASLIVIASSPTSIYGSTPPAVTASYSGFVNSDAAASLSTAPSCVDAGGASSPVGTYATSCSGAVDANYTITYVSGTATVTPASLIVSASSFSSIYGAFSPAVSPIYAGFVNGDTASALSTPPSCTTIVNTTTAVGTYPSADTCSGAADPNYSISYVAGRATVTPASPAIVWSSPAAITYGTALSATQLDATATTTTGSATTNVPGTFTYTPAAGSVLSAGNHVLSVSFAPSDASDFTAASATTTVVVNVAPLTVTASSGTSTYGQSPPAITASYAGFVNGDTTSSLSAPATCSTTASSTSPAGTYPSTCSGAAGANYVVTNIAGVVLINPATPKLTWATPTSITYGTTLNASQLDATASVAGTFSYSPGSGALLSAGIHTLSVNFTPSDTRDYTSASASVQLGVGVASPGLRWSSPPSITYGTVLSSAQLDATAAVPGVFSYTPSAGTVLTSGTKTLSVTFTPTDTVDYSSASTTVTLAVSAATPTLTWPVPSAITYGTKLSSTQLDATASATVASVQTAVPGSYSYAPVSGTLFTPGTHTLSVTFTPTDTTDFTSATASTTVTVNPATLTVTPTGASRNFGQANPNFAYSISGFVNGDSAAVVSGTPVCTTSASPSSAGGTYPITCTQGSLSAANYVFAFSPGVLTVTYSAGNCLSGTYVFGYTVLPGQSVCFGPSATVDLALNVSLGGSVDIEGAKINGIINAVSVNTVRVCGATINGSVSVLGASGAVWIGDGSDCAGNTVNGSVTIANVQGGVLVMGTTINGALDAQFDSGGIVVAYESITFGVTLFDNANGGLIVTGVSDGGGLTVESNNVSPFIVTGNTVRGLSLVQ